MCCVCVSCDCVQLNAPVYSESQSGHRGWNKMRCNNWLCIHWAQRRMPSRGSTLKAPQKTLLRNNYLLQYVNYPELPSSTFELTRRIWWKMNSVLFRLRNCPVKSRCMTIRHRLMLFETMSNLQNPNQTLGTLRVAKDLPSMRLAFFCKFSHSLLINGINRFN